MSNFRELLEKSNSDNWTNYFDRYPNWKTLETLYDNNYYNNIIDDDKVDKIPKIIHQIWVGNKPVPKYHEILKESWLKHNPDWEYKLWTNEDVAKLDMVNRNLYEQTTHFGQKSDILRYELLYRYGGLYVDTDFECLKSFDDLIYLDFFTGIGYNSKWIELNIGIIASVPKYPILHKCIHKMDRVAYSCWKDVFDTTGTYFYTKRFFEIVNEGSKGVVCFPVDYFYPLPPYLKTEKDMSKYIKDCSYAIHYWEVEWGDS